MPSTNCAGGAAEIESDGVQIDVAEGRSALIATRSDIRLCWHAGTEQLIVRGPLSLLERVRTGDLDPTRPDSIISSAISRSSC